MFKTKDTLTSEVKKTCSTLNNKNILWNGYKWYCYDHCKNDSANCKNAYLSTDVIITENYTLKFPITNNPKVFENDKLNTIRKYGCAFIESEHLFSYGEFTFEAILDNSPNTWPALWLYSPETWPPEIDVLEAFPDEKGDIIKNLVARWETNIHYDEYNPKQWGAKGISAIIYKLTHRDGKPDTWKLKWSKDYIKIYFNGVRIRKVTEKEVLDCFNKKPFMRIVINNMLQEGFTSKDFITQRNFELIKFDYKPY